MAHKLTRAEQETIITRTADQSEWIVYSCDPAMKRRLAKLAETLGISPAIRDRDSVEYLLPLSCISLRAPLQVSEEQRAKQVEHGRRLQAAWPAKSRVASLNP
jgi:hypothetical protein